MNKAFQQRTAMINARNASERPNSHAPRPLGFKWSKAAIGFVASIIVVMLFANIQSISDAAQEAVRNSGTPGAFGAPIAILSVAWFAIIPMWFIRTITRGALSGWKNTPSGFAVGAFAGLAIVLFVYAPDSFLRALGLN